MTTDEKAALPDAYELARALGLKGNLKLLREEYGALQYGGLSLLHERDTKDDRGRPIKVATAIQVGDGEKPPMVIMRQSAGAGEDADSEAERRRWAAVTASQAIQRFEREHPLKLRNRKSAGLTVAEMFDHFGEPRPAGKLPDSMRYVLTVPKTIPAGRVLVHNHIQHAVDTPCGWNGFRAWTQKRSRRLERCKCGWSGLPHYRVRPDLAD